MWEKTHRQGRFFACFLSDRFILYNEIIKVQEESHHGNIYGYVRVSTREQHEDRRIIVNN